MTVRVSDPHPAIDRFANAHLRIHTHAQLPSCVIAKHDGFVPVRLEKRLWYPPGTPVGAGAPPPARELRIVRPDEDTVTRSYGDGVGILRYVLSYHTHGAKLLPVEESALRAATERAGRLHQRGRPQPCLIPDELFAQLAIRTEALELLQ